jgi:hypothetical protein
MKRAVVAGLPISLYVGVTGLSIADAKTIYVRKDGNDVLCNGSANAAQGAAANNCAFLTVQKAANTAVAGDICSIAAGKYPERISTKASGTNANNMITFQGNGNVYIQIFTISHNWIKVDGFTFDDLITAYPQHDGWPYMYVTGSNCIISHNIIRHDHTAYDTALGKYYDSDGIASMGGTPSNVLITLNDISGMSGNGICMSGDNITMSYNKIHDIYQDAFRANTLTNSRFLYNETWKQYEIGRHSDWIQYFTGTSHDILVEGNYVHDTEGMVTMLNTSLNGQPLTYNWTFRNNIFANINSSAQYNGDNIKWFNNVFWRVSYGNTACVIATSNPNTIGGVVKNNFYIYCGGRNYAPYGVGYDIPPGVVDADYNYYAQNAAHGWAAENNTVPVEAHKINGGDPKFVAAYDDCIANACDFHLQSNSPAKDAGVAINGWSNPADMDGITRPKDAGWDIGAYEYIPIAIRNPQSTVCNNLASPALICPNPITRPALLQITQKDGLKIYNPTGNLVAASHIQENGIYFIGTETQTAQKIVVIR